jgi:hypothetical protein
MFGSDWMGGRLAGVAGSRIRFTSTQLGFGVSYFLIPILSSFHPIILSYFYISYSHIRIFIYSYISKNAANMNSMHYVRKIFHRTQGGMKRARHF